MGYSVGPYGIWYEPRIVIKAQAVASVTVECLVEDE